MSQWENKSRGYFYYISLIIEIVMNLLFYGVNSHQQNPAHQTIKNKTNFVFLYSQAEQLKGNVKYWLREQKVNN